MYVLLNAITFESLDLKKFIVGLQVRLSGSGSYIMVKVTGANKVCLCNVYPVVVRQSGLQCGWKFFAGFDAACIEFTSLAFL